MKYYIGDLCCVDDKLWDEICEGIGDDSISNITLSNGVSVKLAYTKYGDGIYSDNHGNTYYVDSGTIGCVSLEGISVPDDSDYNVFEFESSPILLYADGLFTFTDGNTSVFIDTTGDAEEDDGNW